MTDDGHEWKDMGPGARVPGLEPKGTPWFCRLCRKLVLTEVGRSPGDGGTEFPSGTRSCYELRAEEVLES